MVLRTSVAIATAGFFSVIPAADAVDLTFSGQTAVGQPDDPGGLRVPEVVVNDPVVGTLDLIIEATSAYDPANRNSNSIAGDFLRINLRNGTATDFEIRIVQAMTDTVVVPDELFISFLDIDGSTSGPPFESIATRTPGAYTAGSALAIANNTRIGQTTFSGTFPAGVGNNPASTVLTQEQSSIAVQLDYRNTGILDFTFDAGTGPSANGRNTLIAGSVTFNPNETTTTGGAGQIPFELETSAGAIAIGLAFGIRRYWRERNRSKSASVG